MPAAWAAAYPQPPARMIARILSSISRVSETEPFGRPPLLRGPVDDRFPVVLFGTPITLFMVGPRAGPTRLSRPRAEPRGSPEGLAGRSAFSSGRSGSLQRSLRERIDDGCPLSVNLASTGRISTKEAAREHSSFVPSASGRALGREAARRSPLDRPEEAARLAPATTHVPSARFTAA